ncbi:MAG: helix-turn-helix transcriptional regulator [Clostridia bacterium]|nr:helix-turn-helix transcriptional regulator [Clostridia bacterium]
MFDTFLYNDIMDMNFSKNNIAELRKSKNLTQRQLAQAIGTSQANLSRWEQGVITPSVIECWKIADFFDVSIDVICGRREY